MAVGFRRRLTALTVPKAALLRRTRHKKLSYSRVRSNSLPGRFHPAVAGLHESANALLAWTEEPAQASPAWIGDGAGHLGRLLAGLTDLLHHPQARDPLQRRGKLLAEAHAALRRRDAARLAAALRARRRSDRDLARLASTLRCLAHRSPSAAAAASDSGEAAVAEAAAAATCAAAAASAAIFAGLASASASSSSRAMPSPLAVSPAKVAAVPVWWVADLLRWRRRTVAVAASESGPGAKEVPLEECCSEEEEERQAAMERLRRLEECVVAAEDGCEQVYRALVNARVSLLNVLTPCF
ncbi:antifreeze protein Maxi [Setaria italica]|uniref:antifreeze protein Maxi n=1 Tax=Setaria italica TaxID=4555 RepID=UPI000BE51B00|nr:antifreeze protein Maxi [Setaria italica]